MQNSDKPMILAPAGSPAALVCAAKFGADAVYFGLDKFNARMKADNFNQSNLKEWVDYCHLFGVKVYVTINTSLKNDEIEDALKMATFCYQANVDALIVTDLGLLGLLKAILPDICVTLSTQQNIHNALGADITKQLGCDTVVLSRETSLAEITDIHKKVDINLEAFLHGALCVCISGQCYFSSMIDANSGNRGLCAQPCRQKYISADQNGIKLKSGYLLSAKDLCNIRNIKKLADAGVSILKIEGRNRRPQYVAQAVKSYREVIDNDFKVDDKQIEQLKKIYNRGDYTNGYLNNNCNIIYPYIQGHKGLRVGVLQKKGKEWFIQSNYLLHDGDAFKIIRNQQEVANAVALISSQNKLTKISISGQAQVDDEAYLTTSAAQIKQLDDFSKKLDISAEFVANKGDYPILTLKYGNISCTLKSDKKAEIAENRPTYDADIIKQISKTGNTYYTISKIVVKNDENFIPVSSLNELRRSCLQNLTEKILSEYNANKIQKRLLNAESSITKVSATQKESENKILLYVDSLNVDFDISDNTILVLKPDDYCRVDLTKTTVGATYYLDLPSFATSDDLKVIDKLIDSGIFKGVIANNLYAVSYAKQYNLKIICGLGLNIFNDYALKTLKELCAELYDGFVYSKELTINETRNFSDKNGYLFCDGQITLMTIANCPVQVNYDCDCTRCKYNGDITYTDKTGRSFALKRKKLAKCYWEVYNCLPLSAADKIDCCGNFMLAPNKNIAEKTYKHYCLLNKGIKDDYVSASHTTGRLVKKVN